MPNKIPVQVFLSYRSHYDDERKALEKLFADYNQQADSKYQLTLIASESEVQKRDNLVDFMERIDTVAIVILLLTDDYFKSSWCLHEMLKTHRKQEESQLQAVAIKKTEAKWLPEKILATCKAQDECFSHLVELQNTTEATVEKRLEEANQAFLRPLRDYLIPIQNTEEILDSIIEQADKIITHEEQQLHDKLVFNITRLIKRTTKEDKFSLQDQLGQDFDNEEKITEYILKQSPEDMMSIMQLWVEDRHKEIELNDRNEWRFFFRQVESICGWLLLKSVDKTWWIHNKFFLNAHPKRKEAFTASINTPAYAEVVIGRNLLSAAEFCLNTDSHNITPSQFADAWDGLSDDRRLGVSINNEMVFDAHNEARAEALLIPMLYDLKRKPKEMPTDLQEQFEQLVLIIKAKPKQIYYLVTPKYFKKLKEVLIDGESLYSKIQQETNGKLLLIEYGNEIADDALQACKQDGLLLEKMADILRINQERLRNTP